MEPFRKVGPHTGYSSGQELYFYIVGIPGTHLNCIELSEKNLKKCIVIGPWRQRQKQVLCPGQRCQRTRGVGGGVCLTCFGVSRSLVSAAMALVLWGHLLLPLNWYFEYGAPLNHS